MSDGNVLFDPLPPLISGYAASSCRVCVTIPARNEAESIAMCLQALADQVALDGSPFPASCFEILLLLNNCDDASAAEARRWSRRNTHISVHVLEVDLAPEDAHVGTARRLLMDTAWHRLRKRGDDEAVILTTDADTCVAPDWIAQNLYALEQGADVVGGLVCVQGTDLASLPATVRRCYERDRAYAEKIAQLEALLDPCAGDPWPRHLDHFGSSLGCTRRAYREAGGMPAVTPLEDEAFVDRVRRAGLILRHEPQVMVWTSGRLQGRAKVGLAGQFRMWSGLAGSAAHRVQSAAFLEHRFRMLRRLRQVFRTKDCSGIALTTEWWRKTFRDSLAEQTSCAGFLGAVYCDTLIEESFSGQRDEPIAQALVELEQRIRALNRASGATEQGHVSTAAQAEVLTLLATV